MGGIDKKKIRTAILLTPPIIALIAWAPPFVLCLMVFVAIFLGLREFYDLTLTRAKGIERFIVILSGLMCSFLVVYGKIGILLPCFALLLLFLSVFFMVTSQELASSVSNMGIALLGIALVGFLPAHVVLIGNRPDGKSWVLFLLATVWAGDISAFSIGSLVGKHRLSPLISPKKTVEGLFGAIAGSILVALAFTLLFIPEFDKRITILFAIALATLGQVGDLTESMVKRSAQVKDSSSMIPGHGGILDRLDSFLFSSPFLYYSLLYLSRERP